MTTEPKITVIRVLFILM